MQAVGDEATNRRITRRGAVSAQVSMDRNAPAHYVEKTDAAIADANEFTRHVLATGPRVSTTDGVDGTPGTPMTVALTRAGALVTPSVIPRFVPTCTSRLMHALGDLTTCHALPVHSHLAENAVEVEWVKQLHPESANYASVYADHGLMPKGRAYFAHCCQCGVAERGTLRAANAAVIHCPTSNFMLLSGHAIAIVIGIAFVPCAISPIPFRRRPSRLPIRCLRTEKNGESRVGLGI